MTHDREALLAMLKVTGALREGHFRLSFARHSSQFVQMVRTLQYPDKAAQLAGALFETIETEVRETVTAVAGAGAGAAILSHEMARLLAVRSIPLEIGGTWVGLARGASIEPQDRILIVEDTVTTGASVMAVMELVASAHASVVAAAFLVDRSQGQVDLGVPAFSLLKLDIPTYSPAECPLCKRGVPLARPRE